MYTCTSTCMAGRLSHVSSLKLSSEPRPNSITTNATEKYVSFIQSREREAQRPGEARRERGRSQRRKPKRVVHVVFGKAKRCRRSVWKSKELTLPALSLPMHPARKLHRYTIHTTSDGTARIPCTIVYPCEFRWNWLQVPMCVIILSGIRHPPTPC